MLGVGELVWPRVGGAGGRGEGRGAWEGDAVGESFGVEMVCVGEEARKEYVKALDAGARGGSGGGKAMDVEGEQSLESYGELSQRESESII